MHQDGLQVNGEMGEIISKLDEIQVNMDRAMDKEPQ